MMDFLRQLAPAREADAARAQAVLPSRFALPHPLQAPKARPAPEDGAGFPAEAGLPFGADPLLAAPQRQRASRVQPDESVSFPLASDAAGGQSKAVASLAPAFSPAQGLGQAGPAPASGGRSNTAAHASAAIAAPARLADLASTEKPTPAASHQTPNPAPGAWPLSQAGLAQRAPGPQDGAPVVQVTIGRIDVTAQSAPAAAPPSRPAPRQPSVSLADYLRGGAGGRP